MMPQAHLWFFADECVSLHRLTDADTYMFVGPLFHGNAQFLAALPGADRRREVGRLPQVQRLQLDALDARLRRHGHELRRRDDGLRVEPAGAARRRRQPAAVDLRRADGAATSTTSASASAIEAFVEVFGLTETAMPIMTPYGTPRPTGAAGLQVADWFDIRLVDPETDEEVPVGEVGELIVRSKEPWTSCQGYYAMPDKTVEVFRNLWFHTGDGLRKDAEGWYYFVDRLKDAIRRRGENICSYEVESADPRPPGASPRSP